MPKQEDMKFSLRKNQKHSRQYLSRLFSFYHLTPPPDNSQDEIKKMKATATTQNVWNNWESEMVKKSAIKRACKTHFKDITTNIDTIDNENFDVELSSLTDKDMDIRKKIDESKTVDEILKVYNSEINNFSDKNIFIQLCTTRKKEILEKNKNEKGN